MKRGNTDVLRREWRGASSKQDYWSKKAESLEEELLLHLDEFGETQNQSLHPESTEGDPAQQFTRVLRKFVATPFSEPRPGQVDLTSTAMRRRCCVLAAPPAAGKTVAIVAAGLTADEMACKSPDPGLGLCSFVPDQAPPVRRPIMCVVVEPTKELVAQVAFRIEALLGDNNTVLHTSTSTPNDFATKRTQNNCHAKSGGNSDGEDETPAISSLKFDHASGSVEAQLLQTHSTTRFVVCTPERFMSPGFVQCLSSLKAQGKLGPVFIDEGHLVAQWGLTFRESYLQLRRAIATAFEDADSGRGLPQVMVLSGSLNLRQAQQAIELLGLSRERTDIFLHPLDRPQILPVVLDLNDVVGTRRDILREGAKRMAIGCSRATRAIVFVATAEDAEFVVNVLGEHSKLLRAVPFYRRLDDQEGADGRCGRASALTQWRDARIQGLVGVLVATVLAAHGLNDELVDFTGHLDQRGDPRTLSQELGRACRQRQPSYGNWLARHPLLLTSAAFLVDFSEGGAAGAFRETVSLVEAGGDECRRARLLRLLGSPLAGDCSGCDGCNPELSPLPTALYKLVDVTEAAFSLVSRVLRSQHKKMWFVELLNDDSWRSLCGSAAEANALFLRLYAGRVLDLAVDEPSEGARVPFVSVSPEHGARILKGEADVAVWALNESGRDT